MAACVAANNKEYVRAAIAVVKSGPGRCVLSAGAHRAKRGALPIGSSSCFKVLLLQNLRSLE